MIDEYQKTEGSKVPPSGGGGGYNILVFKTNLAGPLHIENLEPVLNRHPHIIEWNVDLQDCDKVLRVVAGDLPAQEVEELVRDAGFYCRELQ